MSDLNKELKWFFVIFSREFRQDKRIAFETLMFLATAHFFGFYNPKQLADFLDIPHQGLYRAIEGWSIYYLREMLVRFMVRQAAEELGPLLEKSDATISRAGITLTFDNSVIERLGKLLRCTWSWYSGRCKKVVSGNDLMGIVMTIGGIAFPLHLLFCSKQGRANTDKPALLISMLTRLKEEFSREGIDLTAFPLTFDSWFASDDLKKRLRALGFEKIIIAGKGNYTFTIGKAKQKASSWKKTLGLIRDQWGIDVPSLRTAAFSPTFGCVILFFFRKSSTRTYYLMDFSPVPLRGAEIWHIWKQHHIIECFWKILKSVLGIKAMRLQGDGLHAALLIKVIAYILATRLSMRKPFLKMSVTEIMRKIRRECDLEAILRNHFCLPILNT
ncbi:transposase [Desulfonema magnum]|uniref:Transposase DDE domain-containing protein n=1 Tax=Desulfonema magnum TaxID=45655 RepID=A0A975BWJ5_9BACT|nr:transposase [Desulfonema magnum]QTA85825.1 Transposase family protein, IS4-like [Desulfonema magnum]QTA89949.1 Transposase DDE domain-containing protein [Desulfonema magnum]QTA90601.1 Transposase DDE domain-containing protein [Desulfonema magnum]QTA93076.1 Transposase IS4 domain-containing protein [Desulfonema magnum]